MKIFSFYGTVPQLSTEDETRLIMLWKRAWEKAGFEPIVLNEFIARQSPLFEAMKSRITNKELPSVNPENYDFHCYARWLAMAEVGGGLMSDYDVMPYGWTIKDKDTVPEALTTFQGHTPCLVAGVKKAYLRAIKGFLEYQLTLRDMEGGKPHISDMHILLHGNISYKKTNVVVNFGTPGWETAPLVHFSTSSLTPKYLPRWQHIPTLRPL